MSLARVCDRLLPCVFLAAAFGIIQARIDDDRYIQAIDSEEDHFEFYWLYWMAGSSGCGLLLCLFVSLAIIVLIQACKSSHPEDTDEQNGGKEMDDFARPEKEHKEGEKILLVKGESLIAFKEPKLEPLTFASVITLFVSILFLNAAILCCKFVASLISF